MLPPRELQRQLLAFEAFPDIDVEGVNKVVVIVLSLPWQAGVGAAFWRITCCDYCNDDRVLRDGLLTLTSHGLEPFRGKSSQAEASVLLAQGFFPLITTKQLTDFCNSHAASTVDFDDQETKSGTDEESLSALRAGTDTKRQKQLEEIVQALKSARAKDHLEIKGLKDEVKVATEEMLILVEQTEARVRGMKEACEGQITSQSEKFVDVQNKSKELCALKERAAHSTILARSALNDP